MSIEDTLIERDGVIALVTTNGSANDLDGSVGNQVTACIQLQGAVVVGNGRGEINRMLPSPASTAAELLPTAPIVMESAPAPPLAASPERER